MPRPGSHAYDTEQSRKRSLLEDRGIPDERAEEGARAAMADDRTEEPPVSDRAAGPFGARGRGGGRGHVVDLRSPAFSDHTLMPPRYTAADSNLSPPLEWSPAPPGTVEMAVLCEDLDAPDGPRVHWLVTGIDPAVTSIDEAEAPSGAAVVQDYDGPNPPIGDEPHRYVFRVLALDEHPDDPTRDALDEHRIATGTLVGLYAR
jgi:Raf kinase inhibitor-like YbhB/YbcL family protein